VTDLLNLIGLADKASLFPRQLSGGEAQRVSIARALSTAPKVIFADEPTGNLDREATIKITKLLKKINELGTTLLFATHDPLVIDELHDKKIIHLEKQAPVTEEKKEEKKDEEREKVKEKQEKLEKEINEKKEIKQSHKSNLPKLKLKINFKKDKKEESKHKEKHEST
jgi:ABC-type methionine transport system ATPase subunit